MLLKFLKLIKRQIYLYGNGSTDDIDCASRGRPFVCVDLNLLRLAREWGEGVDSGDLWMSPCVAIAD